MEILNNLILGFGVAERRPGPQPGGLVGEVLLVEAGRAPGLKIGEGAGVTRTANNTYFGAAYGSTAETAMGIAGAQLLEEDFGIAADIWSATSLNELRREGLTVQRWNLLHPESEQRVPYVEQCLKGRPGPVIETTR